MQSPLPRRAVVPAVALALVVAHAALAGDPAPARPAARPKPVAPADSMMVLDIAGMTCSGCAAHVYDALKSVDGTFVTDVSVKDRQAIVQTAKPTAASKALVEAVKKAGYRARVRTKLLAKDRPMRPIPSS